MVAEVGGPVGEPDMQRAIEAFARTHGEVITERELPPIFETAAETQGVIMNGAVGESLGPYYERDRDGLDSITAERVERGQGVTARAYLEAIELAEDMQDALSEFFKDFDVEAVDVLLESMNLTISMGIKLTIDQITVKLCALIVMLERLEEKFEK